MPPSSQPTSRPSTKTPTPRPSAAPISPIEGLSLPPSASSFTRFSASFKVQQVVAGVATLPVTSSVATDDISLGNDLALSRILQSTVTIAVNRYPYDDKQDGGALSVLFTRQSDINMLSISQTTGKNAVAPASLRQRHLQSTGPSQTSSNAASGLSFEAVYTVSYYMDVRNALLEAMDPPRIKTFVYERMMLAQKAKANSLLSTVYDRPPNPDYEGVSTNITGVPNECRFLSSVAILNSEGNIEYPTLPCNVFTSNLRTLAGQWNNAAMKQAFSINIEILGENGKAVQSADELPPPVVTEVDFSSTLNAVNKAPSAPPHTSPPPPSPSPPASCFNRMLSSEVLIR
jgi:hypothetical protein